MRRRLLTTAFVLALATCVGEPATGPSSASSLTLPLQPAIIPGAADATALPVNRIRAVVRETAETQAGAVLSEARFDVDPQAESWEVEIDVPLTGSSAEVVAELSLIHAAGGTEVVEFSGLTRPMTLGPGGSVEPADIDIVRGPLSNLHVTGVAIGDVPGSLFEGESAPFTADATSSGDEAPSVFWVSLEEEVAVVSDSIVTGVAPGITRIVAAAGAHSDTTVLEVLPTPGDITVTDGRPVGSGLQTSHLGELTGSAVGDAGTLIDVNIESLDPQAVLVSSDFESVGATSTTAAASVVVADSLAMFAFWLHGVESVRDTVPVVLSASGLAPDTIEVAVVEPVVSLYGVNPAPDTLTGLGPVFAGVGVPVDTLDSPYPQSVRAGADPLQVTVTSTDPGVLLPTTSGGTGESITADISPGQSTTPSSLDAGGVALDPVNLGSAEASAAIPGFRPVFASHVVEVGAPELTVVHTGQVPTSLQGEAILFLGDSWAHGGSTVTITSDGPEQLLFAADSLSPGTSSLDLTVPDSVVEVPFWIQGDPFAQTGQLNVTASEPRFVGGTVAVDVVRPVAVLPEEELQDTYSAADPNQSFQAAVGYDYFGFGTFQPAPVSPIVQGVNATIESSNEQVLSLVTNEFPDGTGSVVVPIPIGESHSPETRAEGGVELSIEGEGEATLTVTVDDFGRIADLSSRTITVGP